MARARSGLPEADAARWRSIYEATPYRDLPWFSPRPYPWIVKAVESRWLPTGQPVLDLGCGAGTNSLFLARSGFPAHGVDLAPTAIAAARARARRAGLSVDFRVADALQLPFARQSFGGAIDVGCFHTLPPPLRPAYAAEVARVLRPRGRWALTWVAREFTAAQGPPHRPSVAEGTEAIEPLFQVLRLEFTPGPRSRPPAYQLVLERRTGPQPPPR